MLAMPLITTLPSLDNVSSPSITDATVTESDIGLLLLTECISYSCDNANSQRQLKSIHKLDYNIFKLREEISI
jgi:hypothetical protein